MGLHTQCDFVTKYFDVRQQKRAEEIEVGRIVASEVATARCCVTSGSSAEADSSHDSWKWRAGSSQRAACLVRK